VLFDAVAVILSDAGAKALSKECAAIDFVRDAFGHLKAIAAIRRAGTFKSREYRKTRASSMPTTETHSLLRQRRANGTGKSSFALWHKRQSPKPCWSASALYANAKVRC